MRCLREWHAWQNGLAVAKDSKLLEREPLIGLSTQCVRAISGFVLAQGDLVATTTPLSAAARAIACHTSVPRKPRSEA